MIDWINLEKKYNRKEDFLVEKNIFVLSMNKYNNSYCNEKAFCIQSIGTYDVANK